MGREESLQKTMETVRIPFPIKPFQQSNRRTGRTKEGELGCYEGRTCSPGSSSGIPEEDKDADEEANKKSSTEI